MYILTVPIEKNEAYFYFTVNENTSILETKLTFNHILLHQENTLWSNVQDYFTFHFN